jgi:hypothetical protein
MSEKGYQRNLWIEKGRLFPIHSLRDELVLELITTGHRCWCCPGSFRYPHSRSLQTKLDIRKRKLDWLTKRRPKMKYFSDSADRRDSLYGFCCVRFFLLRLGIPVDVNGHSVGM